MKKEQRKELQAPYQDVYENLVDEMATLRAEKVKAYGASRYTDPDPERAMLLVWADLYRKMVRIEAVIRENAPTPGEAVRDTFLDLANYALMGAQLWDQFHPPTPEVKPVRVDQIAFTTTDRGATQKLLADLFGAVHWINDEPTAKGWLRRKEGSGALESINKHRLAYNYETFKDNFEVELIEVTEGDSYVDRALPVGLCHLGIHVTPEEETRIVRVLQQHGIEEVSAVQTISHTNPNVLRTRYKYRIWDTRELLGCFLKLITRVEAEDV